MGLVLLREAEDGGLLSGQQWQRVLRPRLLGEAAAGGQWITWNSAWGASPKFKNPEPNTSPQTHPRNPQIDGVPSDETIEYCVMVFQFWAGCSVDAPSSTTACPPTEHIKMITPPEKHSTSTPPVSNVNETVGC